MNQELEVLKQVCDRLEQASISYMITGSVAASFYAVPRMTRDIDIVIEIEKESARNLLKFFKKDFYVDSQAVNEAVKDHGMFNVIHNESVIKIDFIVRKDQPYRRAEFKRRRAEEIRGARLWMVSPEDLVLSKLDWAKHSLSSMQLQDVGNILSMVKNIDREYIQKWVKSLHLEEIYRKVQNG